MEVAARAANAVSEQERLPTVRAGGTQRGSREAGAGDVSTAGNERSE
jgi:hypothetical protein